jgi:hypothetical protein
VIEPSLINAKIFDENGSQQSEQPNIATGSTNSKLLIEIQFGRQSRRNKPIPPIAGLVDFQSKANALQDGFFPDSAEPPNIPDDFVSSTNDLTQNFYPVTKREINTCLRNLNTASAPGDDKLTYGVVQHFNNSLPHVLQDLFTALFQYKCFPQEWKHENCIIIQKQGRAKQGDPKRYRHISLLSCMGKIFEKIAAKRIATAGVQCGAIANNQMGGQAQNSPIDAPLKTLDRIARDLRKRLNYSKKKPLRPTVLTHDIEGAFNNTHPKLLVQVMHQHQMPQYLTDWATAFTSDRTLSFCFYGLRETPKPFKAGLPQ